MNRPIPALLADAGAKLDVEALLKLVLALLAILLVMEVLEKLFAFALGVARPLFVLAAIVLVVLWLLDRV